MYDVELMFNQTMYIKVLLILCQKYNDSAWFWPNVIMRRIYGVTFPRLMLMLLKLQLITVDEQIR